MRKTEQAEICDAKEGTRWQEGCKGGEQALPWEGTAARVP